MVGDMRGFGTAGGSLLRGIGESAQSQVIKQEAARARQAAVIRAARQEDSKEDLQYVLALTVPTSLPEAKRKRKSLKERRKTKRAKAAERAEKELNEAEDIKSTVEKHTRRNPEFKKQMLMLLRHSLKNDANLEDILQLVKNFYTDVSLQDEALEFLKETTSGTLQDTVKQARKQLNKDYDREIKAGKNIAQEARDFSEKGIGAPTALRDLYRNITGTPRDTNTLFEEMSSRFDYKQMSQVFKFLFHSLGRDMKSQGPSIPRGLLHRLITETRNLQSILNVYRYFNNRMRIIEKEFSHHNLAKPKELTFDNLTKQFMQFVNERYPTPERIRKMGKKLGIYEELLEEIAVYSQCRDAVKEMDPQKIFHTLQHRDEIFEAFITLLEELEDDLEELEYFEEHGREDEEEEQGGRGGKGGRGQQQEEEEKDNQQQEEESPNWWEDVF
ncbi:MAG: type III secretion system gatekeeper subunit SctW [Chlamydiota bacterium]